MARIFLIGPMGSGKSSVGKSLAKRLDYPFYDTDREIEARCGVDVSTIFEFEGEAGFRDRERKAINELTKIDPVIVATGGGSVLAEKNRKMLRERGHVILLSVDIKEQLRRVSLNKNRPLLQVDDVEQRLVKLMEERRELYESTAHHIVSTNSSRMQNVIAKILRHLQKNELVVVANKKPETRSNKKTSTSSRSKARGTTNTPKTRKTSNQRSSSQKSSSQKKQEPSSTAKTKKAARKSTDKKTTDKTDQKKS